MDQAQKDLAERIAQAELNIGRETVRHGSNDEFYDWRSSCSAGSEYSLIFEPLSDDNYRNSISGQHRAKLTSIEAKEHLIGLMCENSIREHVATRPEELYRPYDIPLSPEQISNLAKRFPLSPEQISNLAKRFPLSPEQISNLAERLNISEDEARESLIRESLIRERFSASNLQQAAYDGALSGNDKMKAKPALAYDAGYVETIEGKEKTQDLVRKIEDLFDNPAYPLHGYSFDRLRDICYSIEEYAAPIVCAAAGAAQAHEDLATHEDLAAAARQRRSQAAAR